MTTAPKGPERTGLYLVPATNTPEEQTKPSRSAAAIEARHRRRTRLFPLLGALAAVATVVIINRTFGEDYGCETTTVKPGEGTITAAVRTLGPGGELDFPPKNDALETIVSSAASGVHEEMVAAGDTLQPGDQLRVCVSSAPIPLSLNFGNGWNAGVVILR